MEAEVSVRAAKGRRGACHGQRWVHPRTISAARRPAGGGHLRRAGDYWEIAFDGTITLVRDMKGIRYLERLLRHPGRELHVVDLVAMERGEAGGPDPSRESGLSRFVRDDAGEMLDDRAKAAYRRRLGEIDAELEEARCFGDAERGARATLEREFLTQELSRAVGMNGRDRRAGATSERARASVTLAIRSAMSKINEHQPALGAHLERTIRTGTYCAYAPDPRAVIDWTNSRNELK
jgi:hypothetical protein